ncbi:MAG: galactose oxidase, partial [Schaalia georgiae]|nr:galactose oxidase [Schaalia georgiae]
MRNTHRIPLVMIAAATVVLNGLGHVPSQSAPPAPVRDGLSEAGAAASCWEIKQNDPNAPDGTYWLQTPTMNAPGRFFCDQTSDGGGWVLIGRGTDGWETWSQGKGAPSALAKRERRPADGTVQLSHEAVNGLLGSTPVSELPDGMRVVRAYNGRGTSWQTIKMRLPKMADFVWPFKSAHPV